MKVWFEAVVVAIFVAFQLKNFHIFGESKLDFCGCCALAKVFKP